MALRGRLLPDLQNTDQHIGTSHAVIECLRKSEPPGKLLDVGCATGDFLSVAEHFYHAEGLEISDWSGKIDAERGLFIHKKTLSETDQAEHYDIVTLLGAIEHFEYPNVEIRNMFRILKQGGLVCLWTGDVSSLLAGLPGEKWWYYQGQHIQMFSKRSLCALFEKNGFRRVYLGYYPYVITMQSLQNSLSRYPSVYNSFRFSLRNRFISGLKFSVKLPGEVFALFMKQ